MLMYDHLCQIQGWQLRYLKCIYQSQNAMQMQKNTLNLNKKIQVEQTRSDSCDWIQTRDQRHQHASSYSATALVFNPWPVNQMKCQFWSHHEPEAQACW